MTITTLYKTLSPLELAQLMNNQWQGFATPPAEQTVFAPKLHRTHAERMARQLEARVYSAGFVVAFSVPTHFLRRFPCQTIAYEEQLEYHIPVEALALLNRHLIGVIEPVAAFVNPSEQTVQLSACAGFH